MSSARRSSAAFTVVEVIATISLSAVFLTSAALVYQNITANARSLASLEPITLDTATFQNLLGVEQATLSVYSAPNHGRGAFAGNLAEMFLDDVAVASAVYCLGRDGLNALRPTTIAYPAGSGPLDTPERFLAHLVAQYGAAQTSQFVSYRGRSMAQDLTIMLLQPSASATQLRLLSIYEMDVVPVTDLGNYVAVRRYVDGALTSYYDVLFPTGTGNAFTPAAVHFYRRALARFETDAAVSKYMIAEEHPFYLIWWPDPAARTLEAPVDPPVPTVANTNAVWDYYRMGGRTRFFFAVPAFPSQQ